MSQRFQKSFIPAREFVESWDKELYELTQLDYFIYLMINFLGNQMERRFFIRDRLNSKLYLDFQHLGGLCFNLGDAFEFFVKDNCFSACPLNCLRDLDGITDLTEDSLNPLIRRRLLFLQSGKDEALEKEQCLRLDLMNSVILDTLLQYYTEVFQLELEDSDLELIELAEFLENSMLEFIRHHAAGLLEAPFESAMDQFEALFQNEEPESDERDLPEEKNVWETEFSEQGWYKHVGLSIQDIFEEFLADPHYNPPDVVSEVAQDINLFRQYLVDFIQLPTINEIASDHLGEFFSVWLVRKFQFQESPQTSHIFRAVARFVTYLYHKYKINLKKDFLHHYENLKLQLPRVIEAIYLYYKDYNIYEALLSAESMKEIEQEGYFQISSIISSQKRLISLTGLTYEQHIEPVHLDSAAIRKLRSGDILQASVAPVSIGWEITDIQHIYPAYSKQYLLSV
ncbi:MAG: hypothetical protein Kow0037_08460 [Calditrichia bacterium]